MSISADVIVVVLDGTLFRVYRGGKWRDIAEDLRSRIRSGEYPLGAHLPSTRALAAQHGAGHATVQKAIEYLVALGLVETRAGSGVAVISTEGTEPQTLPELLTAHDRQLAAHEARIAALEEQIRQLRGDA